MNIEKKIAWVFAFLFLPSLGFSSTPPDSLLTTDSTTISQNHAIREIPKKPDAPRSHRLNLNENDGYDHSAHVRRSLQKKKALNTKKDTYVGNKHNL